MMKIITTMIRPKLEYAQMVWSLHEENVKKLEEKKNAKKMVSEWKDVMLWFYQYLKKEERRVNYITQADK